MEVILLVVQVFVALALIIVILIQPPESSSLGGLGGSNPMAGVGSRAEGNVLTRLTGILATVFIVISLILAILAGNNKSSLSILDSATPTADALPPQAETPQPANNGADGETKGPMPVPHVDEQTPPATDAPTVPLAK